MFSFKVATLISCELIPEAIQRRLLNKAFHQTLHPGKKKKKKKKEDYGYQKSSWILEEFGSRCPLARTNLASVNPCSEPQNVAGGGCCSCLWMTTGKKKPGNFRFLELFDRI